MGERSGDVGEGLPPEKEAQRPQRKERERGQGCREQMLPTAMACRWLVAGSLSGAPPGLHDPRAQEETGRSREFKHHL